MDEVFNRCIRALLPGGVWYTSFKLGNAEEVRDGRLFNDYTETRLMQMVGDFSRLTVVRIWTTEDVRPERKGQSWVNALVKKTEG
jgi:hypothetical protein